MGGTWSTKEEEDIVPIPQRQRECFMKNPFATVLWMGFLHAHLSDKSLEEDIRCFLTKHAPEYVNSQVSGELLTAYVTEEPNSISIKVLALSGSERAAYTFESDSMVSDFVAKIKDRWYVRYLKSDDDERVSYDDALRLWRRITVCTMVEGLAIQIVKGHFKKAHAVLPRPIPRDLVHKLNRLPFVENGQARTICVDDGHGSRGQKCPKFIAGYCRGQNLRFTHPCWCDHDRRPTERSRFELTRISLDSAKGVELMDKFMASAPFHNGNPIVISIKAIHNDVLSRCHDEYRDYLTTKHLEEPAVQELYHGTNNNILDVLYKHGLQPPSDMQASERCPHSGGKGLCTSLCNNDCKHCTEKHEWNKCHMYGLGIYLADMAQKSHRYVSQPSMNKSGRQTFKMVVCSVLGKSYQVEGHLRRAEAMHDVVNVRSLTEDVTNDMIERCQACSSAYGVGASIHGVNGDVWGRVVADMGHCWRLHTGRIAKKQTECCKWNWADTTEVSCENLEVAEKSDLLFVKGLGSAVRPGFSVVNSEYIAFHPHQCRPKYEIEYELGW